MLGSRVGAVLGSRVGAVLGSRVGALLGSRVGAVLGSRVGALLGSRVGAVLGGRDGAVLGEQGWCSGESARLPPMWPGFDPQPRRHMWAEFVGFLLCSKVFSGYSSFSLLTKTNI